MFLDDLLPLLVDLADAGTELGIVGAGDVFEQEVEQPAFAL